MNPVSAQDGLEGEEGRRGLLGADSPLGSAPRAHGSPLTRTSPSTQGHPALTHPPGWAGPGCPQPPHPPSFPVLWSLGGGVSVWGVGSGQGGVNSKPWAPVGLRRTQPGRAAGGLGGDALSTGCDETLATRGTLEATSIGHPREPAWGHSRRLKKVPGDGLLQLSVLTWKQ